MDINNVEIKYTKLFIDNEFVDAVSKKTFPTLNPTTGKTIANVAEGDKADVELAVAAAKKAFARNSPWRNMDASDRGRLMNKLADLIEQNIDNIAKLETLDNGTPYLIWKGYIASAVKCLRYYAGFTDKIHGNTIPADGPVFSYTRKEPVGVVGQIVPWNFPFFLAIMKLGAALAAGCTVVIKPAEQTPLTALVLAALSKEAGFPNGVINVVTGYGPTAGAALALHNDVRKIAFTGSTSIGHKIMEYAAQSNLKRVTLELGGKNPLVILNDANLDEAVQWAYLANFAFQGQVCCSGSRTYVQSGIYDEFVKRIVQKVKSRKVGDPFEATTEQGPQIDKPSLDKILRYVELGQKEGAKLEIGGKQLGTDGYFVEPTIFSNVTDEMTIAKEEIFGPVQSILKFDTLEEVIEKANNTSYGLAAAIITKDINNAMVFTQAVEAGSVWVNTYYGMGPQIPFGGYKKSGFGKDMGPEALEAYLETKAVVVRLPSKI